MPQSLLQNVGKWDKENNLYGWHPNHSAHFYLSEWRRLKLNSSGSNYVTNLTSSLAGNRAFLFLHYKKQLVLLRDKSNVLKFLSWMLEVKMLLLQKSLLHITPLINRDPSLPKSYTILQNFIGFVPIQSSRTLVDPKEVFCASVDPAFGETNSTFPIEVAFMTEKETNIRMTKIVSILQKYHFADKLSFTSALPGAYLILHAWITNQ